MLVGLTGGIGAGKSTVAELLAGHGAFVIDADALARAVVEPGQPALAALADRFGADILTSEGRLDRAELARRAFADDEGRAALDAITHPAIRAAFHQRLAAAPAGAIVAHDVALLVETSGRPSAPHYDAVIVVEAPLEQRLARLEQRGLARSDAERRIRAQVGDAERRAAATHVVDNSGDRAALSRQVDAVWADLVARAAAASGG